MTSASAPAEPKRLSPARLSIAYSPCPNDTFIFHAWAHSLVPDAPPIDVTYADIDVTNNLVGEGGLDVMKISYAALPEALERYELLPCGGALGRGCGPLVLTAPGGPTDLAGRTVAVPSLKSTAFLLFQRWAEGGSPARIQVLPFRDIMPAVRDGAVDAGLVIHEARFTYAGYGLQCLADLGEWWEKTTGAPIPLGAIVARRSLGPTLIARITAAIRASVDHAFADPDASREYVLEHAEEMDPEVAKAHIALYVNEFSRDLGPVGYSAVERLLGISLERPSTAQG
ncbi:MAG TPA: 1,4-dihydroxy-6-naphthoate synthase [Actinocrinis sp.]|jgi:1,4-dihydroxy-6-naphthoate synthase|uniref:1,4-dihydroxy-6-naphthoate synthase n=1 Tax=Actinocrinis sp. TaxID=1920516 RepID=UPI002DDCD317|nr:1,4-dihydroxy-6-naphthoate synthase [Actinocrinis sp.]HEV3169682.1 1,4-dihydroxy-6-naphthoate synthase [Actinocrinis sp.]